MLRGKGYQKISGVLKVNIVLRRVDRRTLLEHSLQGFSAAGDGFLMLHLGCLFASAGAAMRKKLPDFSQDCWASGLQE